MIRDFWFMLLYIGKIDKIMLLILTYCFVNDSPINN